MIYSNGKLLPIFLPGQNNTKFGKLVDKKYLYLSNESNNN
jgi:hypothetical protein